jgi:protein TonB
VGSSLEPLEGAGLPLEPQEELGPDPAAIEASYNVVEAALIADDFDAAAAELDALEALDPESSRVAFLRAQLDRARAAAAEVAAAGVAAALAAEAAAAPSELTSLVGLARARLAQQQLDAPAGDSALDYLARAREVDPEAPEIRSLEADLGAALLTAAEIELAGGQFAAAERLFTQAQALGISDELLVALDLSLTYARDTIDRAEQDALLAEANERLTQGLLFEPASASALAATLEVQRRNPDHPGLPAAFAALTRALQEAVATALAAADWDAAEAGIGALSSAGAPLATLETLRGDLTFGRQQEAFLAEPAPAGELAILQFEPPVYPNRALTRGTQGWVDLEFVVDRDGRPRDLAVTGAEPEGEFDAAALTAAETYVFVPFELDGRTYERRVSLRMRFALQ